MRHFNELEEAPAYALRDAGQYLRLHAPAVLRWSEALGGAALAGDAALQYRALSYVQLLELHVLKALRVKHGVPLQRVRRALAFVHEKMPSPHPLLDRNFATDGLDVFLEHGGDLINASRGGQMAIREIVDRYMDRIEWPESGGPKFFPFLLDGEVEEPKSIMIQPAVAFGRPVLAGTGIAAEVVAGRFRQRESMAVLAEEYQVSLASIEDAIRWEFPTLSAA